MATVDDKKIIFSMVGLNKTIQQNNKQVLKNIYLSFFYGAKIGIIGLNGSGKSTLLKIIAGLDKSYQGEAYRDDSALQYFERSREKDLMHPETSRQLRFILGMLAEKGEAETFSYLRRSVLKGKPFPWEEAQDSLMCK